MTALINTPDQADAAPAPAAPAPAQFNAPTPADHSEPHSIPTMVDRVGAVAVEKAANPLSYALRSVVGGAMVAFGVVLSLTVSTGVPIPGLAALVMGLAFGMSFVLILVSGSSLVTADMAAGLVAVLQRKISIGAYLQLMVIGMVGNVAGAFVFTAVAAAGGGPYLTQGFVARANAVATAKAGMPGFSAIMLGVLCTWFLQTALFMYFKARSDTARMGFAFYGPFAFVIAGTQHVIANVGFLGLPLLLHAFHGSAAPAVGWGFGATGFLTNLTYSTIGNYIGGTLFVALPFFLIAKLQRAKR